MSNIIKNKLSLLMFYTASLANIHSIFESKDFLITIVAFIMLIFTVLGTVAILLNEEITYETITKTSSN